MSSLGRRVSIAVIGGTFLFVAVSALLVWSIHRPLAWRRLDAEMEQHARSMVPFLWRQLRRQADHQEPIVLTMRQHDAGLLVAVLRHDDLAVVAHHGGELEPAWQELMDPGGRMVMLGERTWRIWRQPINLAAFAVIEQMRTTDASVPTTARSWPPQEGDGGPVRRPVRRPPDGERSDQVLGEGAEEDQGGSWSRRRSGRRFVPPDVDYLAPPHDHILILLADAGSLIEEERRAGLALVSMVAVAVGLAVLGAWLLTRAVLRPVVRMGQDIADLEGLDQDLSTEGLARELRVVPQRLNALLGRIRSGREQERRFHAAAAHELRTPLAGLRAQLEVALMRERSPEAYRATLGGCLEVCDRMRNTVDRMLQLARLGAGADHGLPQSVDWRALWLESIAAQAQAMTDRDWQMTVDWPAQLPAVQGHPDLLRQVCDNLVGNAVDHGSRGGICRLGAMLQDGMLCVSLENPCHEAPRRPLAELTRAFVGGGIEADQVHAGLGLTLVEALVTLHAGHLDLHWQDGSFVVRCRLPISQGEQKRD